MRHIGAFSKDIKGSVGAVAEQVGGLYEKISDVETRLTRKIDAHTEMIRKILIDVEEIKSSLQQK